jgi:hypothetical protein
VKRTSFLNALIDALCACVSICSDIVGLLLRNLTVMQFEFGCVFTMSACVFVYRWSSELVAVSEWVGLVCLSVCVWECLGVSLNFLVESEFTFQPQDVETTPKNIFTLYLLTIRISRHRSLVQQRKKSRRSFLFSLLQKKKRSDRELGISSNL